MDFIKKHKKLTVLLAIIFIFIIIVILLLKSFSIDTSKSEYGNRLDGIEKVKIEKNTISKLEKEMTDIEEVKSCKYRLQGRLVYVKITFKEGISVENAKEIGNKALEYFSDDEKKYYDIQIMLLNEKDSEGYPKVGYKHKTSESIVW